MVARTWGLKAATALHAAYNLVVCLPLLFIFIGSLFQQPIVIQTEQLKGSITSSSHHLQLESSSYIFDDSIGISNSPLQNVAFTLIDCKHCLKVRNGSPYKRVTMTVLPVEAASSTTLFENTLTYLQDKQLLRLDTSYVTNKVHHVIKKAEACICEKKQYTPSNDLSNRYVGTRDLTEYLYKRYGEAVIVSRGYTNKCNRYYLNAKLSDLSFEEFSEHLKTEYCISLEKSNGNFKIISTY